ncbi:MAG TPA: 1-(5-phosphoribosyl)-5-[(5-phosphoribosylamino)methylideneamino] imidazole-4-carboxamide isomerase [Bacteroidota bacterium]|nr:1-(5-phosphoribosyl)-5-[(5-phosphoribosylamino)methylideneamino] imidazole-4-carboxamide isomerase [Bacteroidota bacterium]
MLLIFPSIEIQKGQCVHLVHGDPGSENVYSIDAVRMAVLWRGENAKTLHVVDLDGVQEGTVRNKDILKRIVEAVDIPVQVGGGLRSFEDVRSVFELGAFRVVVRTAAIEHPELVQKIIHEYGARKLAIAIEASNGRLRGGEKNELDSTPVAFALEMKKLGVSRLLFSVIGPDGTNKILDTEAIKELAIGTGLRITVQGGVRDFQDLLKLQELERFGVDSVVIGKPLYENRFPCQRLWRLNERDLKDMGPTRRF